MIVSVLNVIANNFTIVYSYSHVYIYATKYAAL